MYSCLPSKKLSSLKKISMLHKSTFPRNTSQKILIPRNPFHIVDIRPWPLLGAIRAFNLAAGLIAWFHAHSFYLLIVGTISIALTMAQWWRDVIRESTFIGYHTSYVVQAHRFGILLFIASEAMFFFAFFWAFFHSRLAPTPQIACVWPPPGTQTINPFAVPLLNTAVLLASGFTVTWAHHALLAAHQTETLRALTVTCLLGLYFTHLQLHEYREAPFTIADGIYGSVFFVSTGFHGLHVIIGTTFLIICLYRAFALQFSSDRHFGFEAAAWYWHFVDVIWILLYLCIYWWGS